MLIANIFGCIQTGKMSDNEENMDRLDYLKAKYIFRYPFTIKAIKWAGTIGTFMALHSFIKNRSVKNSFEAFVWTTSIAVFPIWGFFMAKYNFYEDSI